MDDGIVSANVHDQYLNKIIHFACYVREKKPQWMTAYGKHQHDSRYPPRAGENIRKHWSCVKKAYKGLMRQAKQHPVFILDVMTPDEVMEYISSQAHQQTGKPLTLSGYSNKRSSLFHMACCQTKAGWPEEFKAQMEMMWKGFTRKSMQRAAKVANCVREPDQDSETSERALMMILTR